MRVRLADVLDRSFIYDLGKLGVVYSVSPWRKQPMEETLKYRESMFQGFWNWIRQAGGVVLIAESGSGENKAELEPVKAKAVGYLVLQPAAREELTGVGQGWIMDIAVLPEWRGQGVGKMLLKAAEDQCRERGIFYLGLAVSSHNIRALRLYERFGFIEERKLMVKLVDSP